MATIGRHGDVGGYKTLCVVQHSVIPALVLGRVVISNIRGLDLQAAQDYWLSKSTLIKKNEPFPSSAAIIHVDTDNEEGLLKLQTFFHWAPFGAFIVIDEIQDIYPTDTATFFKQFDHPEGISILQTESRPYTLKMALSKQRHTNWDISWTTPDIDSVPKMIRGVTTRCFLHSDLAKVIPYFDYKTKEHKGKTTGQSESHVIKSSYIHADKGVFNVYQSTATNEHVQSANRSSILGNPKLVFIVFITFAALYRAYSGIEEYKSTKSAARALPSSSETVVSVPVSNGGSFKVDKVASSGVAIKPLYQTPYDSAEIEITGTINKHYFFSVYLNGFEVSASTSDLEQTGYTVKYISRCIAEIKSLTSPSRYLFCSLRGNTARLDEGSLAGIEESRSAERHVASEAEG